MNLSSFFRILSFAWQGFWRNFWLSVVTISIIVLTLISINFLIIVNVITEQSINFAKNKIDISLYFKPDITESQVLEVKTYLSSLTQIKEINYVSQQDALEKFKQLHREDKIIIDSLEELTTNPIGATLQAKAKDINDYPAIIEVIENSKYDELILEKNFDNNEIFIDRIKNISSNVQTIGLFTSGVFALIALLIVFNTIRIAIYTHQQEINVMKLVGATNWFIRSPFIFEGVLYGIIATVIGFVLIYPMLNLMQPYISNFFLTDEFKIVEYFNKNFWVIFGLELLSIILLNIISSSIAIRRYLRV